MLKSLFSNTMRAPDIGLLVLRIAGGMKILTHDGAKCLKYLMAILGLLIL